MIWDVIIHNINFVSNRGGGFYMCGDKIFGGYQVWNKTNSGLVFKIMNKSGMIEDENILLCTDVDCVLQGAYVHWHRVYIKLYFFRYQGPNEVLNIINNMDKMVGSWEITEGTNKIYDNKPAICCYDYF